MSRTRHVSRPLVAALAALALAACGGSDSTGPDTRKATLIVVNESAFTIVDVHFSKCSNESWGPDRLGGGESIAPGEERSWDLAPGCYDVRAKAQSGASAEWRDRRFGAGQTRRLTAAGG